MKFINIFLIFIFFITPCFAKEVLAPALQFEADFDKYKDYFKLPSDYIVKIKSLSDFKITCDADIVGVSWEDVENIKFFDIEKEDGTNDMKSVILKSKYETYTYARLYKSNKEILNLILNVNTMYRSDLSLDLGQCKLEPYRG